MADIYLIPGTYTGSVSWTNGALWSSGVAPASNDNAYLLTGQAAALRFDSGLNQGTVCLGLLVTSDAGPKLGGTGTNYLNIGATNQLHGIASADGSTGNGVQCIKVNSGTWGGNVTVLKTATQSGEPGVPCACFLGANTNNVFNMTGGLVGLAAISPAETATFPTINVEGGTFAGGKGLSYTNAVNSGAAALLQSGGNTVGLTNNAGTTTFQGVFAVGSVNGLGGNVMFNNRPSAGGTLCGSVNLNGATIDFTGNPGTAALGAFIYTAGNVNVFSGGQVNFGTVTEAFGTGTKMRKTVS